MPVSWGPGSAGRGSRRTTAEEGATAASWKRLAELASLGLVLPSSIAVGLFLGYFLDRWLGTEPWLLIILTLCGVVSGFLSLYRGLRAIEKEEDEGGPDPRL